MTLQLRTSLAALVVPALAPGMLLAGVPSAHSAQRVQSAQSAQSAQAETPRPTRLTVQDPLETGASHDIRRVQLYSGSPQDPAAVTVMFARRPLTGDTVKVWFDTDADPRPEYLAKVVVNQRMKVFRTRSWVHKQRRPVRSKACFTAFTEGRGVLITVSPRCLKARSMRVSVTTKGQGVIGPDHAPARRTWSPKVRFVR